MSPRTPAMLSLLFLMACGDKDVTDDSSVSTDDSSVSTDDSSVATDDSSVSTDDSSEPECLVANPPTNLVLEGQAMPLHAPGASWTAPEEGCAPTAWYELAVGVTSDDDVAAWTRVDDVSWDGVLSLPMPSSRDIHLSVRAVDTLGNVSESIGSDDFQVWAPTALAGLVAWYDWSDPDVRLASDCSTSVGDGVEIVCGLDKSGNNNSLGLLNDRQLSAPGPVVAEINGVPAADFHGEVVLFVQHNDSVSITTNQLLTAIVDAPSNIGAGADIHYPLNKEGAYEVGYRDGNFVGAIDTVASGFWGWGIPNVATTTAPQLNVFGYDGAYWGFRRDGETVAVMSPPNGQTGNIQPGYFNFQGRIFTETPLVLGGRPLNNTLRYEAIQGEVVLLEVMPSEEELYTLEDYLMQKWGL